MTIHPGGYFVVAMLPLLYACIPNPVLFRWFWIHPASQPPDHVTASADRWTYRIAFVSQAVLLTVLVAFVRRTGMSLDDLGLTVTDIGIHLKGVLIAAPWLTLYVAVALVIPHGSPAFGRRWELRLGLPRWICLSVTSAIVEESWRAVSLVALEGSESPSAIAITAVAFGLAHPRSLTGAATVTVLGAYLAWWYLRLRALGPMVLAHVIINIGVFLLIRAKVDNGSTLRLM